MLNHLSRRLRHLLKEASRSNGIRHQSQRLSKHDQSIRLPNVVASRRHAGPQAWPQRLLVKKGARMHATSLERGDNCSIAILDSRGVVVAWHDSLPDAGIFDRGVIGSHVSQFYPAEDVALQRADRQLNVASVHGSDTREGWYRRANGSIFWGVTVIESLQLANGDLHGYSHVTRYSRDPCNHAHVSAWRMPQQYSLSSGMAAAA